MTPLLKEKVNHYFVQQKQANNKMGHLIGVPALLLAILIFSNWFSISIGGRWHIAFSWILLGLLIAHYYSLDFKIATAAGILLGVLNLLCVLTTYPKPSAISGFVFLVLFIGGMILQFSSRAAAFKSQSSLLNNLEQLLIAPICLLIDLIRCLKLEKHFDIV